MINERELELVHAFVYDEKYICLPKEKSLLGTHGLCGEPWKKAVNAIPGTPCPQPHAWRDILCTQSSRAALVGVDGAGCSPGLIHQLLKPGEPPPWWCSHAMGKRGGSLLAKMQQERLCGRCGLRGRLDMLVAARDYRWPVKPGGFSSAASLHSPAWILGWSYLWSERRYQLQCFRKSIFYMQGQSSLFLPCFLLSECNIPVAFWSMHFSCAAAVSKKVLSYPAQQKRIDKSYLSGNFPSIILNFKPFFTSASQVILLQKWQQLVLYDITVANVRCMIGFGDSRCPGGRN